MHKIGNWRNQLEILRLRNLLDRSLLYFAFLGFPGPYWTSSLLGLIGPLTGPY